MSVYTVHQPPLRAGNALPNPERFAFVRDGFHFWAFVAAVLWMLWHRMWLVLLLYVVIAVGVEAGLLYAGIPEPVLAIVGVLLSLLVAVEAGSLRRFTLARRGWRSVAVVSGDGIEDAERRFFDAWLREERAPSESSVPPAPMWSQPPGPPPAPRPPFAPDVIGLFPEPGGRL